MTDKIVSISGGKPPEPEDLLKMGFAKTVEVFRHDGSRPTAAVFIVMDDTGAFRVGWECRESKLPGTAIVGMAIAALHNRNAHPYECEGHD